jgi:hypothetical protein
MASDTALSCYIELWHVYLCPLEWESKFIQNIPSPPPRTSRMPKQNSQHVSMTVSLLFVGTCSSYHLHWSPLAGEYSQMALECSVTFCDVPNFVISSQTNTRTRTHTHKTWGKRKLRLMATGEFLGIHWRISYGYTGACQTQRVQQSPLQSMASEAITTATRITDSLKYFSSSKYCTSSLGQEGYICLYSHINWWSHCNCRLHLQCHPTIYFTRLCNGPSSLQLNWAQYNW